jgi:YVTN family beta-propeller protein
MRASRNALEPGRVVVALLVIAICIFARQTGTGGNHPLLESNGPVSSVHSTSSSFGGTDSEASANIATTMELESVAPATNLANTVIATIPLGHSPGLGAYDSANGNIYIPGADTVSAISGRTNSVTAAIRVGNGPDTPAFDGANGDLYVANDASSNVSVIAGSTNSVITSVPVGAYPSWPAYDSTNGDIYVPTGFAGMSVISGTTNTVVATIPVGECPQTPIFDNANDNLYVVNECSYNMSVISGLTNTVTATIPLGNNSTEPVNGVYDSLNGDVYVPNVGNYSVTVISGSTNEVVGWIEVGPLPYTPAFDSANGDLYVPSDLAGSVYVISGLTNKVLTEIPVGLFPASPVFDSSNGDLYVVTDSNNVIAISGVTNTVVANLTVGVYPYLPVFDSANGNLFVSNSGSNDVSVIAGGYPVTFIETGLLSGPWSVSVSTTARSAQAGSPIMIEATNGTWTFVVGAVAGYIVNPTSGAVTVAGGPQAIAVTYSVGVPPTYLVTFSETGLAPGTTWTVSLNGYAQNTSGTTIAYQVPTGTFQFSVEPVSSYTVTPAKGNVTVTAEPTSVSITFTPSNGWLSGTVIPTSAVVMVGGALVQLSDGTFNVSLAPGTCAIVATATAHAPYFNNVTVLAAKTTRLAIVLAPTTVGTKTSEDYTYAIFALVGGVVAGLAGGYLVGRGRRRGPKPLRPAPPRRPSP